MGNKNNSSFTMHEPLIWNVYRITDTQSRGRCFARLPTYYAGHQLSRAIPKMSKKMVYFIPVDLFLTGFPAKWHYIPDFFSELGMLPSRLLAVGILQIKENKKIMPIPELFYIGTFVILSSFSR